jgi:hypothetical protein
MAKAIDTMVGRLLHGRYCMQGSSHRLSLQMPWTMQSNGTSASMWDSRLREMK